MFIFALIFVLCMSFQAFSQWKFRAIDEKGAGARTAGENRDSTKITLPFWDDFSRTNYLPDSTHWFIDSGTSTISSTLGIEPPTVNVAVFDGWNNLGVPYSDIELEQGAGDSLVSRFIDLSGINPALYGTLHISFFWEKMGRGEVPDDPDSIRLQVMDQNKNWQTVWVKTGADVQETNVFFQEIVPLTDAGYFHDYFQFRFQSFGRLSGGFDTWNIDYVYLNINRNASDLSFEDRALTSLPGTWLTKYTAMPYDHFIINLEQNLILPDVGVYNLDDQVQPVEFHALIQDSTKIYDKMNEGTPYNLAPKVHSVITTQPIDPAAFDKNADSLSLMLETKFYINSGDSANWLGKYDYRTNDTTTTIVMFDEELAYDDGTAEWAAGLSQKAAILAYRYIIPKPDAITEVKIYFPEFSPPTSGKVFTLVIWDDIFQYREGRLLTEQHTVKKSDGLNRFTTYTLGRPVVVTDTFYVGYEQSVSGFFPVGLDKNGRTEKGNIFINLGGAWEPSDIVDGNLMIRPVFGFKKAVGFGDEVFRGVSVYPNPSYGTFNIRGTFERAEIYDILGIKLLDINAVDETTQVKLENASQGLYLIKIHKEGYQKTFKMVIK